MEEIRANPIVTIETSLLPISVKNWILDWNTDPAGWYKEEGDWNASILWHIWKARCEKIFEKTRPNPGNIQIYG
ncbi:hypothetical protein C5167_020669 [Papaver somniferum]|uniref:Uncharacterized protein n=1 Tax=Papaver somniferum TaxID=3469 RepID=A0A4Y7IU86_PAPSO|nr:hypothetical protein C5167_020669 [Papaver somniferum]